MIILQFSHCISVPFFLEWLDPVDLIVFESSLGKNDWDCFNELRVKYYAQFQRDAYDLVAFPLLSDVLAWGDKRFLQLNVVEYLNDSGRVNELIESSLLRVLKSLLLEKCTDDDELEESVFLLLSSCINLRQFTLRNFETPDESLDSFSFGSELKVVDFSGCTYFQDDCDFVIEFVHCHPGLVELSLPHGYDVDVDLIRALLLLRHLKKLMINCFKSTLSPSALMMFVMHSQSGGLKEFTATCNCPLFHRVLCSYMGHTLTNLTVNRRNKSVDPLLEVGASYNHVTDLTVTHYRDDSDVALLPVIQASRSIRTLDIIFGKMSADTLDAVVNHCPQLENLRIKTTTVSNLIFVSKCINLVDLKLVDMKLTVDDVTALLKGCPRLRSLDISENKNLHLSANVDTLAPLFKNLRTLLATHCGITDAFLFAVSQYCESFVELRISSNKSISVDGLISLLVRHPHLSVLHVYSFSHLFDYSVSDYLRIVASGPNLRDFNHTKVIALTDEEVHQIKQGRPKLKLVK